VWAPGSQRFARSWGSALQACSTTGRCNSCLASTAGKLGFAPGSTQRSEARLVYALRQAGPIAAHVMRVYAKKMPQACEQHASSSEVWFLGPKVSFTMKAEEPFMAVLHGSISAAASFSRCSGLLTHHQLSNP
jgi:hypothetical protein